MAILVISYPELTLQDFGWIQSIRARHDRLYYNIVKPHITLVFPISDLAPDEMVGHVRSVAGQTPSIPFVIRHAKTVPDQTTDYRHVLLVPDEGYDAIVEFHNHLHTGPLADQPRPTPALIPHITVGNSQDQKACRAIADNLNKEDLSIAGRIADVDLISYEDQKIETIEKINLAGAGKPVR